MTFGLIPPGPLLFSKGAYWPRRHGKRHRAFYAPAARSRFRGPRSPAVIRVSDRGGLALSGNHRSSMTTVLDQNSCSAGKATLTTAAGPRAKQRVLIIRRRFAGHSRQRAPSKRANCRKFTLNANRGVTTYFFRPLLYRSATLSVTLRDIAARSDSSRRKQKNLASLLGRG